MNVVSIATTSIGTCMVDGLKIVVFFFKHLWKESPLLAVCKSLKF